MKQRKQLLNSLGLSCPHLSQHLLRLLLLLVTAIGGVGSSWAETYKSLEANVYYADGTYMAASQEHPANVNYATYTFSNTNSNSCKDENWYSLTGSWNENTKQTINLSTEGFITNTTNQGFVSLKISTANYLVFHVTNCKGVSICGMAEKAERYIDLSVKEKDSDDEVGTVRTISNYSAYEVLDYGTELDPSKSYDIKVVTRGGSGNANLAQIRFALPEQPDLGTIKSVDGTTTTWDFTQVTEAQAASLTGWTAEGTTAYVNPTVDGESYQSPTWCSGIQIGFNQKADAKKSYMYYNGTGYRCNGGASSMIVTIPAGANTLVVKSKGTKDGVYGVKSKTSGITFVSTGPVDGVYTSTATVSAGQEVEVQRAAGTATDILQVITSYEAPVAKIVSFDVDNKGGAVADMQESAPEAGITLPKVTPIPDHTFLGWDSNNDGTADLFAGDLYKPNADITLKAIYRTGGMTIGADNSLWWSNFSGFRELLKDNSIGFTFTNNGGNDFTHENWVMIVTNNGEGHALDGNSNVGSNELYLLRPDGNAWGNGATGRVTKLYKDAGNGQYSEVTVDGGTDDAKTAFINAMKNATVNLDISYEGEYIYTIAKITSSNGNYILVDKSGNVGSADKVWISFTTEKSSITFSGQKTNDLSVKVTTATNGNGAAVAKIAPGIQLVPERPIAKGTEVIFQAVANEGNTLVNWIDANSNVISTETDFTKAINETVTYTANFAATYDYSVVAKSGSTELKTIANGTVAAGSAVTVYYPMYILENGTLYKINKNSSHPDYGVTFTPDANNYVKELTYSDSGIENVVYFTEAEDLSSYATCAQGNGPAVGSNGKMARGTNGSVTNLAPGKYKIWAKGVSNGDRTATFTVGGVDVFTFSFKGNFADAISDEFSVTTESTLKVVTVGANTDGLDCFYIVRTGDITYESTTWTFSSINDPASNTEFTENGLTLTVFGGSWQSDDSGVKLNSNDAYISFTPNADGVLTIKGSKLSYSKGLALIVTIDGEEINCTESPTGEISFDVVAGKEIIVKRADSSARFNEIVFTPTSENKLLPPTISIENGVATFTNPNANTTLFYKYDRTKDGNIDWSNMDGQTEESTYSVALPYGHYPQGWIQALAGKDGVGSDIAYAEEVYVAPEPPVFTKTATEINFTVPTGCFIEFHVGASDAEAIPVYSTSATVSLNLTAKTMTIANVGYPAQDRTFDIDALLVKTVAEYSTNEFEDDGTTHKKGYIGSELIEVTPEATNVQSVSIPESIEIHVGQTLNVTVNPTWIDPSGNPTTATLSKRWVLTSGSEYLSLSDYIRTSSKITGTKSNTSDNATAKLKVTVDGVESNECTVTIKRTPLAVRADHVALSHKGNEARTLHAIAYNPYTRVAIGKKGNVEDGNLTITAAPKSGTSAFATSSSNTITPNGTATGTETWVVTVAPKTDADKVCYTTGTAEIQVTCRDYLYAYNTSVPATTPTARPVENASNDVALNYYAGHNPADCRTAADDEPLKVWGDKNRGPQEQDLALYASGKQKPYARIHGWDGIKNVAEPTMNSLSEQHTENPKGAYVYNGNSNGQFTYLAYNYYGNHNEFDVPVMGSFYRFYPEKNGTLIAYLCVNGQFSDSDMDKLSKDNATQTGYASRYTYFLDPYASSMPIENPTVQPTSTVQTGFFYYTLDNCKNTANLTRDIVELLNHWSAWGNDEKDANGNLVIPVKSASYAAGKTTYTIDDVDWVLFKKLAQDPVGVFQQPIANGDGSFRVITKTYVRCEVPVEKGRVYYVSPTGTKTRMAGVEFIPDTDDPVATDVNFYNGTIPTQNDEVLYELPSNANPSTGFQNDVTMTAGNFYNVTLADRTFKADQWYTFCMPFDVPEKQIHDIFGEGAVTIHFDNATEETIDGEKTINMNFWSHFYDQIRAGRPIMVKMPAKFPGDKAELAAGDVTFKHVKYNPVNPESLFMTDGKWIFKGTYTPVRMEKNAVIVNNQSFYHYLYTEKTLAGNRAWIQGPANSQAPVVTSIRLFNSNEEEATGIEAVLSEMGFNVVKTTDKIYNLNGQMVGQGADINNLPKGVYIVNGKKQIVK